VIFKVLRFVRLFTKWTMIEVQKKESSDKDFCQRHSEINRKSGAKTEEVIYDAVSVAVFIRA
jgi:hypothetical protein